MLGLLSMYGVGSSAYSVAIVGSLHDAGPSELLFLRNQHKINQVFSSGIYSFVDLIEENYSSNIFFVFKSRPKHISMNGINVLSDKPVTEDGRYIAFWGPEMPHGHKKNSWPIDVYEKSGQEVVGQFTAVDVIKEDGMFDMLNRIKRDGRRSQ
jgi:hypothetical protein